MRKILLGISLSIALSAAGCANSQLHQSLLLHENRQLEDALYTAHARIADLKRENDLLRQQQEDGFSKPSEHSSNGPWDDDFDLFPPIEMQKVILPGDGQGTTEVPEALKGSQTIPSWSPRR